MPDEIQKPTLQDFSLIKTKVLSYQTDLEIQSEVNAFYFFVLELISGLQEDEVRESVTDTNFISSFKSLSNKGNGHDRGIDAVFIDESGVKPKIHFFNLKYCMEFEKTKGFFPSGEIDKIHSFINALMQKDMDLPNQVNALLGTKIKEIWQIFDSQTPEFVFHICTNGYYPFELNEKNRFEKGLRRHSNFSIEYHLMNNFVTALTQGGKKKVDAKFRAIAKLMFEKSDGDIRALIAGIYARDLIRIVLDDDSIRGKVDIEDYLELKQFRILEDAFEDNVRIYLKRSKVNKNIKSTALSNENHRFFYYNNGITITCERFEYPATIISPIVELTNLQIVNGSQTIHSLYDAFCEDPAKFKHIEILCRIYETRNGELSTNIAEYTNSQNPVNSRDIRSIDFVQQKLEQELLEMGYWYERKKHQYSGKPRARRIDAEKVGQALMAFFNKMPSEAKDKKRVIFAEKYDDVFNDTITADKVLLCYSLFEKIEKTKNISREKILSGLTRTTPDDWAVLYSSYYILYLLGEIATRALIPIEFKNVDSIWKFYPLVVNIMTLLIEKEMSKMESTVFSYEGFFKKNRPKKYLEGMIESGDLDRLIKEFLGNKP